MNLDNSLWRSFTAAPHRMMFLAGAAQGLATVAWWLVELLGRHTSAWLPPAWAIPAAWAHGFLMIYGFFPFFIFGFLMTVYPNWMNGAKVPPRRYVPAFLLLAGGVALFYLGLAAGKGLLLVALLLMLAGWGISVHALIDVLVSARHPDKLHPKITSVALVAGWIGLFAYLLWLVTGNALFAVFALKAGVWFLLLAGGMALFYLGLAAGKGLLLVALLLMLAGWGVSIHALLDVLISARHPDKLHPKITSVALVAGWLGLFAYLLWLMTGNAQFAMFALKAGVWFLLLPVFFTVSHRMIPFFSSRVLSNYAIVRPVSALWVMLACSYGHGLLEIAGANAWLWLVDLPLLAQTLYLSWRWQLRRSFEVRLLAVLHVGFAWVSVALALYAVQSLALLSGRPLLGFAPLHALTIGLFGSMVLGMASRVTLGHSGADLECDGPTWALFWGFQLAALARIGGDLPLAGTAAGHFYLLAAVVWLACFGPWFVKYAPKFWRPRSDGQPG